MRSPDNTCFLCKRAIEGEPRFAGKVDTRTGEKTRYPFHPECLKHFTAVAIKYGMPPIQAHEAAEGNCPRRPDRSIASPLKSIGMMHRLVRIGRDGMRGESTMGLYGKRRRPSWWHLIGPAAPQPQPDRHVIRVARGRAPDADELAKLMADGYELVKVCDVGWTDAEVDLHYERPANSPPPPIRLRPGRLTVRWPSGAIDPG
jgi:hypothetical protein